MAPPYYFNSMFLITCIICPRLLFCSLKHIMILSQLYKPLPPPPHFTFYLKITPQKHNPQTRTHLLVGKRGVSFRCVEPRATIWRSFSLCRTSGDQKRTFWLGLISTNTSKPPPIIFILQNNTQIGPCPQVPNCNPHTKPQTRQISSTTPPIYFCALYRNPIIHDTEP